MGSQDYIKFYFIKFHYNPKDSHQNYVDPKEEGLESSWGWLRQQTSLIFILARASANNFHILHYFKESQTLLIGKAMDKVT